MERSEVARKVYCRLQGHEIRYWWALCQPLTNGLPDNNIHEGSSLIGCVGYGCIECKCSCEMCGRSMVDGDNQVPWHQGSPWR